MVGSSNSGGESGGSSSYSSNGGENGVSSSGSSSSLFAGRPGGKLRLVWKSCTVDSKFFNEASPRVDALAREHGWSVLDVRQVKGGRQWSFKEMKLFAPPGNAGRASLAHVLPHLTPSQVVAASQRQGLLLTWTPDSVHFLQLAYETFNDLLLNILCPLQPAQH